jgi:hypothetical protein
MMLENSKTPFEFCGGKIMNSIFGMENPFAEVYAFLTKDESV